jgi:hypothetical protein
VKRREFITLLVGGAAAWPLAARAQRSKPALMGLLGSGTAAAQSELTAAFVQRLRELGWIEGRNLTIEYRWAEGRSERFAEIAAEFVHQVGPALGRPVQGWARRLANRASTSSPRLIEKVGAHRANRPPELMVGRLAAVLTVGILLADCSGSTRLDGAVLPRGLAPPRSSTQSMPKYDATGSVGRSKSNIETQVPEKTSPPAPPSQESNRQASPAEE